LNIPAAGEYVRSFWTLPQWEAIEEGERPADAIAVPGGWALYRWMSPPADAGTSAGPACQPDPELSALVATWPDLPTPIRAGIMAMIRAARLKGTDGAR
jgi:hypothetical protein